MYAITHHHFPDNRNTLEVSTLYFEQQVITIPVLIVLHSTNYRVVDKPLNSDIQIQFSLF